MAIKKINIGQVPNNKKGDKVRDAFSKANDNFSELDTRATAAQNTADAAKAKADAAIPSASKDQASGVAGLTPDRAVGRPVQVAQMPVGLTSTGGPVSSNKRQVVSVGTAVSEAGTAQPPRYLIFKWNSAGHTMFRVEIAGYVNATASLVNAQLAGYIQSSGSILNVTLSHFGNSRPPIGMCRRGVNQNCIVIDLQGISYPAISIIDAQFAYPGSTDLAMMSFSHEFVDAITELIVWGVDAGPAASYVRPDEVARAVDRGFLAEGANLNQLLTEGVHKISSGVVGASLVGGPSWLKAVAGNVTVTRGGNGVFIQDLIQTVGAREGVERSTRYITASAQSVWQKAVFEDTVFAALRMASYTKATVPSASANSGTVVHVSNAAGGAALAVSNGTAWISQITGAEV